MIDTIIGLAVIAIASIWIYRLTERILYIRYKLRINNISGHHTHKADPESFGYQEQAAKVIYDTSLTLSEVSKKQDDILAALKTPEAQNRFMKGAS